MNINKSIKINFPTFIFPTSTHSRLDLYLLFINLIITKIEQNGDNGIEKEEINALLRRLLFNKNL